MADMWREIWPVLVGVVLGTGFAVLCVVGGLA